MKFSIHFLMTLILVISAWVVPAQTIFPQKEDSLFNVHGEIYFKFQINDKSIVDSISRIISIDNYKDGEVFAYANRDDFTKFLKLNIDYTLLRNPGSLLTDEELNMGNWQRNSKNMTIWNFYPTYSQYLDFMNNCVTNYPTICKLDTIGTTIQGRLLLALKISDSVNYNRGVPQVLFTSSMHGDETTGYVMMMHLIDSLLNSYGTSTRITNMINKTQILINPLANPDGTYRGGNSTVGGAIRGNANLVDLNRNYPDPRAGQHPDGKAWQPETVAFMNYADINHINLAMNFHGGAEVVNYPWDTWAPPHLTADDSWWKFVSKQYADTCHTYGAPGYFTNPYPSGYVNGATWYVITGGRQDYHNYYKHIREVTLEISFDKNPAAGTLLNFWKYNYRSFFNFIEQANYGINGRVSDSLTNASIAAKVFISGYDIDSSFVYSALPSGWYFRMIDAGTRNLTFSAPGYYPRTITGVSSSRYLTTRLNVKLLPHISIPVNFLATAFSGNQINLSWLRNISNDSVMILVNTSSTFGTPNLGTTFQVGDNIPGGGTVIYKGFNTSYSHTTLDPATRYYYQAFSFGYGNYYSIPALANATTHCGISGKFPFSESFNEAIAQLPYCWTQENTSAGFTKLWIRNNSALAGGTAWEMRLQSNSVSSGTIRLKPYSITTVGVSTLTLTFKHHLTTKGTGVTLCVQSSSDGITWTTEAWSYTSPSGTNVTTGPGTITVNITNNLNIPSTMIAFVAIGNQNRITNWYIDDVSIKAPGYWVGGTPGFLTNWDITTNWGDNLIPGATTNVYIPQRMYLPVVANDPVTPARCNNLTISGNAGIKVSPGKKIEVNGTMTIQ